MPELPDDTDELDDAALLEALESMDEKLDQIERRVDNIEDKMETKVRVVDTDRGKRIVLENRQQTWFSPKYFEKILENIGGSDGDGDDEDEDVLMG